MIVIIIVYSYNICMIDVRYHYLLVSVMHSLCAVKSFLFIISSIAVP